jgi:penicillin-binding protein 1A
MRWERARSGDIRGSGQAGNRHGGRLAGGPLPVTPKPRWRRPWFFLLALPVVTAAMLLVFVAGTIAYYSLVLPHPMVAGQDRRPSVIRILGHDGELLAERGVARDYIPLDMLPPHIGKAVTSIEDRRFYNHRGIDLPSLARALLANLKAGRTVQGGSTLTQQLAKNLFLSPERHFTRKIEELLISIWLEARLSKKEILELYLNRVYFGAGAHGIESAAERYFGKSARNVTVAEAAVLAGLLKAPSKFSPLGNPGLARSRARVVLKTMQEAGALSQPEAQMAAGESVQFVLSRPPKQLTGMEYAVDFVMEQMLGRIGDVRGDLTIETTLDGGLQKRAQSVLREHVLLQGEAQDATQGAVVVLDLDGSVRALVGGRSYAESQYNRATKGRRQPGSAFKPFVFLAALEGGLSPDSFMNDEPLTVHGWTPRNFNGTHKGSVTLREALATSINTVAVRLYLDAGKRRVVATARRLGITSDLLDGPSLALGASEVTALELTNAYVPFANGGAGTTPIVVRRVLSAKGRVLFEAKPKIEHRLVDAKHVAAMNDMLHHTVTSGTGRAANLRQHAVAGKTGTSQDFRDAWFVGYTGHLVGGVWIGNDSGKSTHGVAGGGLPAKIWRDIMKSAHEDRAPAPLAHTNLGAGAPPAIATGARPGLPPQAEPRVSANAPSRESLPGRIDDEFLRRAMSGLPATQ